MSGASVPYHLRPHKSVDRRLFLDLLMRLERWKPLMDYAYISMGAYPLEDHKLVHRHLGIDKLIAFDFDEKIVARQKFNKPVENCHCIAQKSGDFISNIDSIMATCSFSQAAGRIIWLDYTDPTKLGVQVREFQALIGNLAIGDVVRVTVNAHPLSLSEPAVPNERRLSVEEMRERQFQKLKSIVKEFLPADSSSADMTRDRLPVIISKSFGAASLKIFPATGENTFFPLSMIRYADGLQMLSITGIVIERFQKKEFLERVQLPSWPFFSSDWSTVHQLLVPALTLRERLFLERGY